MSQRQRDWDEVDGEKQEVNCRETVKHIKRTSQLYVTRMTLVDKQE